MSSINLDGVYLYYTGHLQNQVLKSFGLAPRSISSLSEVIGNFNPVISDQDYFNYRLYFYNNDDQMYALRLKNTLNNETFLEIIFDDDTNVSDALDQVRTYILTNINSDFETNTLSTPIEDGIYRYTNARGRVNGTFDCKIGLTRNAQLDSYGNIINEYYNIENGELTGYITRKQNADYDNEVWDLESKLINDPDAGIEVTFSSLEPLSNNELVHLSDLNDPIKLVLRKNTSGTVSYSTYLLEKVDQLDFNAISSYENIGFYADPVYSQIDFTDPSSYLDAFLLDAQRHGIDVSHVDVNNYIFELVESDDDDLLGFRAVARRTCDDDNISIKYTDTAWEEDISDIYSHSFPKAFGVMWHEFGHDILNLKHLCLGGHIMSGRHQDPRILNDQSECDSEYITMWSMKWNHPDPNYNMERAVDDLFNSDYHIIDCD